ncbi:Uncharacterised protein [Escherichia coli]|nr:Uncharacterised protein [Escherichia coli]
MAGLPRCGRQHLYQMPESVRYIRVTDHSCPRSEAGSVAQRHAVRTDFPQGDGGTGQFWPVVSLATWRPCCTRPQGVRVLLNACQLRTGISCGAAVAPSLLITGAGTVAAP